MQTGDIFGRLTALSDCGEGFWLFRCVCGKEKRIYTRNVVRGATKSCGCLQKERASAAKTTHGHSRGKAISPEYAAYRNMVARCYRPTNNRHARYSGRDITVCEEWLASFEQFLTDMGPRPSPEHSIDREDNDQGYGPGNCRWATRIEQARNRADNIVLTIDGEQMCLAEAAERFAIPYATLKARIFRSGWSHERAVREPVRAHRPYRR